MDNWGRRVVLGSLLGATIGVLIGLGLSRILWTAPRDLPVPSPVPTSTQVVLTPTEVAPEIDVDENQEEATSAGADRELVLVSALYALDGDLARARERLTALGLDDPAGELAELALKHGSAGNQQVATDLATLAAALGHRGSELVAYVATPTFTPLPLPTDTPSPTETPVPTETPMPSATLPPPLTDTPVPAPTRPPATQRPQTATPLPMAATPLPLEWDMRVGLLNPPIRLVSADVGLGQKYWRLVRLEWQKASEGGNTMLYVSALNENGVPVWGQEVIIEHGIKEKLYTDPKPGEPHGTNYHMTGSLNSYQAYIGGDLPSERVVGLGLGEWLGGLDHNTFILVFQRSTR